MSQNAVRFSVSSRRIFREACGFGIPQSHLMVGVEWQLAPYESFSLPWTRDLDAMLDEPCPQPPAKALVGDMACWFGGVLGTLLRGAGIATARNLHVQPLPSKASQIQRCIMAIPVTSMRATMIGMKWLLSFLNEPPTTAADLREQYFQLMASLKPHAGTSLNHWRTLQAAYDEGYPVLTLSHGFSCIGTGRYRRWFDSFITDQTPYLGLRLAQNKQRTAAVLRSNGFPGAVNRLVQTQAQALEAAHALGFPVVVKPNDRDRGEGVFADLVSEDAVAHAYALARQHSSQVLVEKFQPGFTHRCSVVQGLVLRVAKHMAFGVVGDGHSSIAQLVDAVAQTLEQQKRAYRMGGTVCTLDDDALGLLAQYGRNVHTVPVAGEYVRLRRKDNVSAGGRRITLTLAEVHPDNIRLAVNVTALLGLDFAGVDLITPDISRSWRDVPVTICEVNGNPQLVARDDPDMYKRVLKHIMPAPFRVQITLVLIWVAPDQDMKNRLIAEFSASSTTQGLSMAEGVWVGGQWVSGPFDNGFTAAVSLCTNAGVCQLTIAMTVAEVLNHGLPLCEIDRIQLPVASENSASESAQRDYKQVLALVRPHIKESMNLRESV